MSDFNRCGSRALTTALFLLAVGAPIASPAQVRGTGLDSYRHTYDREFGYVPAYGYGYGYGLGGFGGLGGTVAGNAGYGLGQAAQGLGQMHLQNAQAAGAYEQAVNQYLQNKGLAMPVLQQNASERHEADARFQETMKEQDKAQVALYHQTMEQMSAAHRLTAEQFDMGRGVLHWPFVLRGPKYKDLRNKLDLLYDARTPADSGKNSDGYPEIVNACQAMTAIVNDDVRAGMPVTDYVTATHFISSVEYEAQFRVKAATADAPAKAVAAAGG
jgi:hypothetical protein